MNESSVLRPSAVLQLLYEDRTKLGALVSGQAEVRLKRLFARLVDCAHGEGVQRLLDVGPQLIAAAIDGSVRQEDVLYPPPSLVTPNGLKILSASGESAVVPLAPSFVGELAAWIGEWQRGSAPPVGTGPARDLWTVMDRLGCLGARHDPPAAGPLRGVATFVGHATVQLRSETSTLLVDPFLMPTEEKFPATYQPVTFPQLAPDVVLVTHSHRDHFHLDTLLRFGKETLIVVPEVERESILAVDMRRRLSELGFSRVRTLRWFEEMQVGGFRVVALPFYGEQPTIDKVLFPEARNIGNTYVVEAQGRRYAFIADAGRDHLGDVRELATDALAKIGPLDVLFGGYRSWSLYPAQYALTSVPQYLLFVPPPLFGVRQQIMNDAHALIDTAERWKARHVVPYADGGAPWYWQLDLGPPLDRAADWKNPHFDPRPEAVLRAAADRSSANRRSVRSSVRTLLMRPGESLDFDASGAASILENEGHRWPYADHETLETTGETTLEPLGLTRKRVLLRMLATEELARRGVVVDPAKVQAMSDELRRINDLVDRGAMVAWMNKAGLSMTEYSEILLEWQNVMHLEGLLAEEIERRVTGQRAFASMRTPVSR